jgi:hypothetical protein
MTEVAKRLYNAVAAIFADGLAKVRQQQMSVAAGTGRSVLGLCAKWAPTMITRYITGMLDKKNPMSSIGKKT